jgi:hypothetical protein
MVTSLEASEKNVGYRGSKSVICESIAVKEQRVDGSWCSKDNLMHLRCTLMGFERNYQVKILSKQINKVRWYTSTTAHKPSITPNSNLGPWFLTGFADAECSLSILIQANSKYATGWRIKPVFAIGLHKKDIELLKNIQSSLGVGKIHIHGKDSIQFRVDSIKELQVVINHFESYPLVTAKWADYILFKKAFDIILLKEHLSPEGLLKLVGIKASLNLGLNASLKEAFPNWKELQYDRPNYIFCGIPDPNWMAGFASGDSSFNIKINNSPTSLLNKRVQLRFGIGLNIREKALIQHLAAYFDLSDTLKYIYFDLNSARFEAVKFSDITDKIIPFFEKHSIQGKKSQDFVDFKQAAGIIKSKGHLTSEGLERILEIKARMNE